jgi:hypothetical protein
MKTISFVFVGALSVAAVGCKKSGDDCSKAINNSMEVSKADMEKMPGMDSKTMDKMKELGIQHCRDDKWAGDAIKCMTEAKTETEARGCYGKLTQDQRDRMNQAAMDLRPPSAPGGNAGAGTTGNAAGAGSAPEAAPGAAPGSAPGSASEVGSGSSGSAAAPK